VPSAGLNVLARPVLFFALHSPARSLFGPAQCSLSDRGPARSHLHWLIYMPTSGMLGIETWSRPQDPNLRFQVSVLLVKVSCLVVYGLVSRGLSRPSTIFINLKYLLIVISNVISIRLLWNVDVVASTIQCWSLIFNISIYSARRSVPFTIARRRVACFESTWWR